MMTIDTFFMISAFHRIGVRYASRLSAVERLTLAAGAAFIAFRDPRRGDMVALLDEVTAGDALPRLRQRLADDVNGDGWGPRLLEEKPRLRAEDVRKLDLESMEDGSFGKAWAVYLETHGFDPDARSQVHHIEDEELAWILQRYREVHDLWHVLTDLPPSIEGELALKWLEMTATGLPMPALASFVGPLRLLNSPRRLSFFLTHLVPWAASTGSSCVDLLAVPYETILPLPIQEVRQNLGLSIAPRPPWDLKHVDTVGK